MWFSRFSMTVHWVRHQLHLQRASPKLPAERSDVAKQGKAEEELRNSKTCPGLLAYPSWGKDHRGRDGEDVSP